MDACLAGPRPRDRRPHARSRRGPAYAAGARCSSGSRPHPRRRLTLANRPWTDAGDLPGAPWSPRWSSGLPFAGRSGGQVGEWQRQGVRLMTRAACCVERRQAFSAGWRARRPGGPHDTGRRHRETMHGGARARHRPPVANRRFPAAPTHAALVARRAAHRRPDGAAMIQPYLPRSRPRARSRCSTSRAPTATPCARCRSPATSACSPSTGGHHRPRPRWRRTRRRRRQPRRGRRAAALRPVDLVRDLAGRPYQSSSS